MEGLEVAVPQTITIGGVDRTAFVNARKLRVNNELTKAIDTCSLEIRDYDGTLAAEGFDPIEQELVILDSDSERIFGGVIKSATQQTIRIHGAYRANWSCKASDFTDLLSRVRVTHSWELKSDADILAEAFSLYLPSVNATTHVVSSGTVYTRFISNRESLLELVGRLAKASGFDWYVDANKNLHYFPSESDTAPFALSDTPNGVTSFAPIDLRYTKDSKDLCNLITVVGGNKLSPDVTITFDNLSSRRLHYLLPYKFSAPIGKTSIQVEENVGTDESPVWSPVTVGIDNIDDEGSVDALYNYNEKLLKFSTPPGSGREEAVRVTGRYPVPILIRSRSADSFNRYGTWYEDKHVDTQIQDEETARRIATSILAERAFEKETLSFSTYQHGLRAGQSVHVTDSVAGLDGDYLIHSVSVKFDGADNIRYDVSAGEWNPSLINLLQDIRRRQFQETEGIDEVVTEVIAGSETLTLEEVFSITQAPTLTWGVSQWGAALWGSDS